jgi:hypothetical protein
MTGGLDACFSNLASEATEQDCFARQEQMTGCISGNPCLPRNAGYILPRRDREGCAHRSDRPSAAACSRRKCTHRQSCQAQPHQKCSRCRSCCLPQWRARLDSKSKIFSRSECPNSATARILLVRNTWRPSQPTVTKQACSVPLTICYCSTP